MPFARKTAYKRFHDIHLGHAEDRAQAEDHRQANQSAYDKIDDSGHDVRAAWDDLVKEEDRSGADDGGGKNASGA